ncbi:MAG: MBL fold metallo-hydrolase [Acidobacteriota bacterium]
MKITQIRNATQILEYGPVRFLIDPMMSDKGSFPGFPGTINEDLANPIVGLPLPFEKIVEVDVVILTHLHQDHWDAVAAGALPKSMPILVQDERDAAEIRKAGFVDVLVVTEGMTYKGVTLYRTRAVHGVEAVYEAMPPEFLRVTGFVFGHPSEKTTYLAADTIWFEGVAEAIGRHHPDVIVVNSGNAQAFGLGRLIMNAADVLEVHKAAPAATIVGTHMEAVNHCVLTRSALRTFAEQQGFSGLLKLPSDGETIGL